MYSTDPAATRRFFQDVLRWPCVTEGPTDEPEEWLIFRTGPSEMGVHPTRSATGEVWGADGQHQLTFMCDDLHSTMAELAGRGARFEGEPRDLGFGLGVALTVPGAGTVLLHEPTHPVAVDL
ncbi:VOC family protein [Cellulomonas phragmiteti]|uniref:VOC family protein n=1 Tax=Cellulomonas phragmiteti TaxID=478780 RepID=UPI001943D7C6